MKLCVSNDWLRREIEGDPDVEVEAGRVIHRSSDVVKAMHAVEQQQAQDVPVNAPQLASSGETENVLGRFVLMTRRKDRLTPAQLADRIRVAPEEITSIERDPGFSPKPRTVHQLARYVKVPSSTLLHLLPNARQKDVALNEAAHRFAASSDNLPGLSRAERKVFNEFVKFLSSHKRDEPSNGK
ncbi:MULTISPECIES: helix-turn-helix domain-containing protein [unclassified Phaeobacter]|uniref:helix-turn-helix domain-containing protein n=1 Tax=unclassified Phaeobacter TaxID=2621772 RepID=UPI003A8981F2